MGVNIGLGDAENPDLGYQLYLTALVMVLVAGMVVLGRLAARWAKKAYGYDDYAIIISFVRFHDKACRQKRFKLTDIVIFFPSL